MFSTKTLAAAPYIVKYFEIRIERAVSYAAVRHIKNYCFLVKDGALASPSDFKGSEL